MKTALLIVSVLILAAATITSCGKTKSSDPELSLQTAPQTQTVPATVADSVFLEVDEMAQFNGGDAGLLKYISNSTTYPEEAKKNNITGRVVVKFVVGKDCTVSNVEIVRGVNPLLDAEALRVVSSLPKFEKPAIKSGNPVAVQFMLPITFALK